MQQPPEKRIKLVPPTNERIMIYVRQESEDAYTALHLVRTNKEGGSWTTLLKFDSLGWRIRRDSHPQVPPSVPGLIAALESKYKISASNIRYLYRKTRLGVNAKIDDDMLRFYTNEDVFLMQVRSSV